MTKLEKICLLVMVGLCAVAMVSQSVNYGLGLPTNGPCVGLKNMAGICSDNGIPSVYGMDGVVVHLPVPGPQGDPGRDGVDGQNGAQGPQGIQGNPGKDAVFPQTLVLTCPPVSGGSIPKGFTATCTLALPQ